MAAMVFSRYIRVVQHRCLNQALLLSELKRLVADIFRLDILVPDSITDDERLTGGNLDLDSFDILELSLCVEESFGIAIRSEEESRLVFSSIGSLAEFIRVQTQIAQTRQTSEAEGSARAMVSRLPASTYARSSIA
jgi:acyl carrier protein